MLSVNYTGDIRQPTVGVPPIFIRADKYLSMEKSRWHRLSEVIMFVGFLAVIPGAFVFKQPVLALAGFVLFLAGVEVYLKTRKTPYED